MNIGTGLALVFQIWMLIEAWRRGQAWPWFLIIFIFWWNWIPLGAVVYFVLEVQTFVRIGRRGGGRGAKIAFRTQRVTADQLRQSAAEVKRLDNAAAWSDHASLLRARGQHAEAAEAAAAALAKDPEDLQARYERGRALLELNRAAEAAGELEIVLAAEPNHDYGDGRLALAQAWEAVGELQKARAHYERLGEGSSRPDVLFHLAQVQEKTGDLAAARATFQRVLDDEGLAPAFARGRAAPWVRRSRSALRRLEQAGAAETADG